MINNANVTLHLECYVSLQSKLNVPQITPRENASSEQVPDVSKVQGVPTAKKKYSPVGEEEEGSFLNSNNNVLSCWLIFYGMHKILQKFFNEI